MHFPGQHAQKYQTPEQIVAHIDELMAEAEAMLEGPVVNPAQPEVQHLRSRLAEARAGMLEFMESAQRQVTAGARFTDEIIRAHPYFSLALAVAVGVIAGALIPRRPRAGYA
ncbi:MAG: protein of unknown function ElaB [Verrucomicrobia bacterium]|nr:protein of unknown function ElaB [Verrucomicrobiota bacterium]